MLQTQTPFGTPGQADQNSQSLFERGLKVFPDGTTRGTVEKDPLPRYVAKGEGAYLVDVDGNRFLDLNNNFTTLIHGHGFAPVVDAVARVLRDGTCFSNPTVHEINLAELLCARIPVVEQVRFVNTGTEAVMFAIKAARALTGRSGVAKVEGAYHGAYDWAEISQASTPANWGDDVNPASVPVYTGSPTSVPEEVVVLRFNDAEAARRRIRASADKLACVLIDPMPSRAGLIAPEPDFVRAITETARECGIVVICDEVLNLRQSFQGASARYGITPDIIVMGKIIGGGFPIGAIGGSCEAMAVFGANGQRAKVPQGGTFSANPVSVIAGLVSMQAMGEAEFDRLEAMGDNLRRELNAAIDHYQSPFSVTGAASLFRIHPKRKPPADFRAAYTDVAESALSLEMTRFFRANYILLPVGAAACLSTAMTDQDITHIIDVFTQFLESPEAAIGASSNEQG